MHAYLLAAFSIVVWASSATVVRILNLPARDLLAPTCFYAWIAISACLLGTKDYRLLRTFSLRDWAYSALLGIIGIFLYYYALFAAFNHTTAQQAFVGNYTWPIWTIVLSSLLLKQRISKVQWFATLLCFSGIVLLVLPAVTQQVPQILGLVFALGAGLCYGIFSAGSRFLNLPPLASLWIGYTASVILAYSFSHDTIPLPAPATLGIIYLGAVTAGLGILAWLIALRSPQANTITLLAFLTPVLSVLSINIFTSEAFEVITMFSLILILCGVLCAKLISVPLNK